MMELKVWVEGIQRIVCGVTDVTTCQDVVYALAHATGKTGRFTLMERWRNSERLLAPHEHPLKILLKWGEYASDVQFILQRTAFEQKSEMRQDAKVGQGHLPQERPSQSIPGAHQRVVHKVVAPGEPPPPKSTAQSSLQGRDIKKSLTFSGGHSQYPLSPEGVSPSPHSPEVGALPPQGFVQKVPPLSHPHPHPHPSVNQDPTAGLPRHYYPSNSSSARPPISINRPPAPPPYELVRGHPPPPPPSGGLAHTRHLFHSTHSAFGPYNQEWRIPAPSVARPSFPYPPPLRTPQSSPGFARPQRELPPYRDPPPPPPPSHPALLKISPPKVSQSFPPPVTSDRSQTSVIEQEKKLRSGSAKITVAESSPTFRDPSGSPRSREGLPTESPKGKERLQAGSPIGKERLHTISKESLTTGPKTNESLSKFNCQKPNRLLDKVKKEDIHKVKEKEDPGDSESPVPLAEHKSVRMNDRPNSPLKPFSNNSHKDPTNDVSCGDVNENLIVSSGGKPSTLSGTLKDSTDCDGERSVVQDIIKQLVKNSSKEITSLSNNNHTTEEVVVDGYYRELVKLVNQQREKISSQQVDLTKYEAEIAFAEGRWKEEESRLAYLQEEIQRLEKVPEKQVDMKLMLQLEDQLKAAKKSESTTQEEISLLKKKIGSCDEKLTQMNNRIRSIEDALRHEEQIQKQKLQETFQEEEQEAMMREIEKLQIAVDQATKQADQTQDLSKQLSLEMQDAESRLDDKRKEIEALKQAMREANLEALSMTPPDEAKSVSESRTGNGKGGTNRRMVGSPRQLETAVPTSKNPHGVWV